MLGDGRLKKNMGRREIRAIKLNKLEHLGGRFFLDLGNYPKELFFWGGGSSLFPDPINNSKYANSCL